MNLYLFSNHNYYNRKIKRYETIEEYEHAFNGYDVAAGVNFIPNDGIITTQVVNYATPDYSDGSAAPSYCVVADGATIVSRWWVTESVLIRKGQSRLSLLRDVIADYYDIVMNSPAYISRGYISSTSNPLIYSPENFYSNQVKQSEILLYDRTKMPWIVGYVARNLNYPEGTTPGRISIPTEEVTVNYEEGKEGYSYNQYTTVPFYAYEGTSQFRVNFYGKVSWNEQLFNRDRSLMFAWGADGESAQPLDPNLYYSAPYIYGRKDKKAEIGFYCPMDLSLIEDNDAYQYTLRPKLKETTWSNYGVSAYAPSVKTSTDLTLFLAEEGKILKDGDRYYRIHIGNRGNKLVSAAVGNTTPLGQKMQSIVNYLTSGGSFTVSSSGANEPIFEYEAYCTEYYLYYEEIPVNAATLTIPADRVHLKDAPYDMFCIPVGELNIDGQFTNADFAWRLAAELIDVLQTGSSANMYDIQLLPYCPISEDLLSLNWYYRPYLLTEKFPEAARYYTPLTDDNGALYSAMIWCDSSSFSRLLNFQRYRITVPSSTYDFKVANQCDMYRLCSPNYSGQFEFSATKNGGVASWNVDCTYKPFSPYIQVAPNFSGLYGQDFGDARGLICGGDFSITQISSAWQQYQLNNKNYQVMFDRQIENMDAVREIQRKQEAWNIVGGSITGVGSGALGGAMLGGGVGSIAGGIVGGGLSLAGGLADLKYSQQLYELGRDYTRDIHQLGIENIMALPYGLTKVGSQTINYKVVPFVEYYSATEEEKQNLYNKLAYNGMTVEAIGMMINYLKPVADTVGSFVQAVPIRLEGLNEDSHIADTIANELGRGVYIL